MRWLWFAVFSPEEPNQWVFLSYFEFVSLFSVAASRDNLQFYELTLWCGSGTSIVHK